MRHLLPIMIVLVCSGLLPGEAQQIEPRTLFSPIINKPFEAIVVPTRQAAESAGLAGAPDMGTDDDGCRHSSGISEYDHYVVTDPYSYFSALADEWNPHGQFMGQISKEFRDWILSKDGFHEEWVTDKDRFYDRALQVARGQGRSLPAIHEWVIPEDKIPIEKRYRYALTCYQRRQASMAFQAKLALTAAWALRVRLNRPLVHTNLKGGIEEVDALVQKHVQDGEEFRLEKWTETYRKIFESSKLTDEGYFTAGATYVGFLLRTGDHAKMLEALEALEKRYKDKQDQLTLRGLVRTRRQNILDGQYGYVGFLNIAVNAFCQAMANEEFARPHLPEVLLAVAECQRRTGNLDNAMNWYLALTQMDETQPQLRSELRAQKKVPSMEAPFPMLLAWRAEEQMAKLVKAGVQHNGRIGGPHSDLLNAVLNQGLGTPSYKNPAWKPRTGAGIPEVQVLLDDIARRVLVFRERTKGEWPRSLDDLWMRGIVRDRNQLNRFCCPSSGKPLRFAQLIGDQPARTVLLACPEPVADGKGGKVHVGMQINLQIVTSAKPLEPGVPAGETAPPKAEGPTKPAGPADAAGDEP